MRTILHCDNRGYCLTTDGTDYRAGCQRFASRADALAHWSSPHYPDPERGQGFVHAIEHGRPITALPDGLSELSLGGGTLPSGTALPGGCTVHQ